MPIFNEEMYLYDKNQNSDLFHLHSFGRLFPDADYIISLKDNSNTIIECVTDGVGYIEHNGTVTTVEKGDCYIMKERQRLLLLLRRQKAVFQGLGNGIREPYRQVARFLQYRSAGVYKAP